MKFFVGGTNYKCPDKWMWCATKTLVSKDLPWTPGEPNNLIKEESSLAVYMRLGQEKSGLHDTNPMSTLNFLCEV